MGHTAWFRINAVGIVEGLNTFLLIFIFFFFFLGYVRSRMTLLSQEVESGCESLLGVVQVEFLVYVPILHCGALYSETTTIAYVHQAICPYFYSLGT